jgi:hypothetical protein
MIKEAGLFVISAGFLVYFISPRDEQSKPQPTSAETTQRTVSSDEEEADYWGEEKDDEHAEQEFVFGEPMTGTEPASEDGDSDSYDEDSASREREVASKSKTSSDNTSSPAVKSRRIHSSSPKPGELGSAENPIPLN